MDDDKKEEGGCDCGSCPGCGTDDAGNEPEEEKSPEDEEAE